MSCRGTRGRGTSPCSGEMFSSCAPCSALVEGVKSGVGSFCDSWRPSGSGIPCTVRVFLYSAHAEPGGERRNKARMRSWLCAQGEGGIYSVSVKMLLLTCDVTPYDRLEGYNLCFLDEDGTALELLPVLVQLFWHLFDARRHDVVRDDTSQLVEPEERKFGKDTALVRNALYSSKVSSLRSVVGVK